MYSWSTKYARQFQYLKGAWCSVRFVTFFSPSNFEKYQKACLSKSRVNNGRVSCEGHTEASHLSGECHWVAACCSSPPNQQDARQSQYSAFKTNLFEDECQAERDYVPFLNPLVWLKVQTNKWYKAVQALTYSTERTINNTNWPYLQISYYH